MGYSVNHQRGGFQRVNFRVISSPLGVKVLISAEEEIQWGQVSYNGVRSCFLLTMPYNGVRLAKLT